MNVSLRSRFPHSSFLVFIIACCIAGSKIHHLPLFRPCLGWAYGQGFFSFLWSQMADHCWMWSLFQGSDLTLNKNGSICFLEDMTFISSDIISSPSHCWRISKASSLPDTAAVISVDVYIHLTSSPSLGTRKKGPSGWSSPYTAHAFFSESQILSDL